MNTIPPDWNEDRKLWNALGVLPRQRPPSNFAWSVRRKLQATPVPGSVGLSSLRALLRSWTFQVSLATACFVLGFVLWQVKQPAARNGSNENAHLVVQLVALNGDLELIQDLDVIEHLDTP